VSLALALLGRPSEAALPPDFIDELVASVPRPTAMAFLPDGRLLVAQQTGDLRVIKNGILLPTPALSIGGRICSNRERGLVGLAVDPEFAANRFVYLYYTARKHGVCPVEQTTNPQIPVNRVSRFVQPAGTDTLNPASETILIDNIPQPGGFHLSGDLHFGPDGYLYISAGDGGCDYAGDSGCQGLNDAARDSHVLLGKILRITRDGGIPPDNPFQGAGTARCNLTGRTAKGQKCQETFASGLRNPFRFAFDPNSVTPRFFINDVGGNAIEEINEGIRGADYGWNCREGAVTNNSKGPCSPLPAGLVGPIFGYAHRKAIPWSTGEGWPGGTPPSNCHSVTGGAFVPDGLWPGFDGSYLWSDYVCGGIFALRPKTGGGYSASDFATALGESSAVALLFGPANGSQALYYSTYTGGGQIRRIRFTGASGNNAPVAILEASPRAGTLPLTVTFDASDSSDPDPGDTLTYVWAFGDGSGQQTTSQPVVQHTYNKVGTFTAILRVRDDHGTFSLPATAVIGAGNQPPVPVILTPAASALFAVGDEIRLRGNASDPDDGALPASALSWTVLLHHNNDHTHPYFGPVAGNDIPLTAPAPEDLAAATGSFLEILLTATDSKGLSSTVSQTFQPKKAALTFQTNPPGLKVDVNDATLTGPETATSWERYPLKLDATSPQFAGGNVYFFQSWSDGGAAIHTITTPAGGGTYTANFTSVPDAGLALRGGRFRVAVSWKTPGGESGFGHAIPRTTDSGEFWFFNAENLELIVKVLDGCANNNRYWFFAGGLTNVEVTIVVTDTLKDVTRTYTNPQETAFRPIQDTAAFATCP
jgi:glucose/arabinose dehydrogenase/PKD repeat protein